MARAIAVVVVLAAACGPTSGGSGDAAVDGSADVDAAAWTDTDCRAYCTGGHPPLVPDAPGCVSQSSVPTDTCLGACEATCADGSRVISNSPGAPYCSGSMAYAICTRRH